MNATTGAAGSEPHRVAEGQWLLQQLHSRAAGSRIEGRHEERSDALGGVSPRIGEATQAAGEVALAHLRWGTERGRDEGTTEVAESEGQQEAEGS